MNYLYNYSVIGGDLRQVYLAEELACDSLKVSYYGLPKSPKNASDAPSLDDAIKNSHCIICPIPFSKNNYTLNINTAYNAPSLTDILDLLEPGQHFFAGCIPKIWAETASNKGVTVYDLMENDSLALFNSIATAEGAICEAISKSVYNLHHSRCAVLGYGKCGRTIAAYLKGMFCNVYAYTQSDDLQASANIFCDDAGSLMDFEEHAEDFDFIFNTIPSTVITYPILNKMKSSVTIIDIASAPGGVDYEAASKLNLNATLCPGLPGRYSPASSAKAIKNIIRSILECL